MTPTVTPTSTLHDPSALRDARADAGPPRSREHGTRAARVALTTVLAAGGAGVLAILGAIAWVVLTHHSSSPAGYGG